MNVSPQLLRSFTPFDELAMDQLIPVLKSIRLKHVGTGCCLMELGSRLDEVIYLVDGKLRLTARDGMHHTVESGTEKARAPIAQLLPRRYRVETVTPVDYLKIERSLLDSLSAQKQSIQNKNLAREMEDFPLETALYMELERDIENDCLVLPSLPGVATKMREALEQEIGAAEALAGVICSDPAITAKLIKVANSPEYIGNTLVGDCVGAILRLGTKVIHELVVGFEAQEVFNSSHEILSERMSRLWEHSVAISDASRRLARRTAGFDPHKAYILGLLHDIGIIPILAYAGHYPEIAGNRSVLDNVVRMLRGQIGAMILHKWGFPQEFVQVVLEAEDWERNPGSTPDYCDLVLAAHLYSGQDSSAEVSGVSVDELPVLQRLQLHTDRQTGDGLELQRASGPLSLLVTQGLTGA